MAKKKGGGRGLPKGFVSKAQWRYFFANPALRVKYAHKEAHKAQAAGGGKVVAYRRLPHKLHAGRHVAR